MNKNLRNTLILFLIFLVSITFFELIFKMRILTIHSEMAVGRILLFTLSYSILFLFIIKFFNQRTAKIITYTILGIITFLYINQEIYSIFYKGLFLSLSTARDVGLGWTFLGKYVSSVRFGQLLYLLPVALVICIHQTKLFTFEVTYRSVKMPLFYLIGFMLVFFASLQTIDEDAPRQDLPISYSDMDLYTYMYDPQAAIKKFGLLTYTQRDFFSLFRDDPLTEDQRNVLLESYFSSRPRHYDNTYSDLFEDKNLILITAESLDTFAINEELTPTLYRLTQEHSYFENYYSPLFYRSTADTEFQVQTSFYPDKNVTLSMESYIENAFPYTLPRLFEARGYETYSFHNYTDYFYPRTQFHVETLGYNHFYGGIELGMFEDHYEGLRGNHQWQSDLEMMELAIPMFIEEDKFFVNMLTVSGHLNYNSNHLQGSKHEDAVLQYELDNGLDLDDEIFWYLAANIELDLALEYLLQELENANKLEDTVIVIFGDHYAYGVNDGAIWEYDEIKEDYDDMDLHNVPFILVNNDPAITIFDTNKTNFMSGVDMIPTLSNLFNLPLDYRMVMGKDALAGEDNIVKFADLSFISKDYVYESISENYEIYDNAITEDYLYQLQSIIVLDYMTNIDVLQYDFFREDEE